MESREEMKASEEKKEKKLYFDEKGNPLENKIIDLDENILKDKNIIKLIKEQEELLRKRKNKRLSKNQNEDLEEILKKKQNELNKLKLRFSQYKQELILNPNEKLMSVIFVVDEIGVEYSVICKNTDLLSEVIENKLRKEKDGLDHCNDYFITTKENILDLNKSIEENRVNEGDIIYLNHI